VKLLSFICAALFACMLMVNTTYASATDTVNCPSVDKIRQAASLMTKAEYNKSDKMYAASSTAFVENNIEWKLGSLYIQAHSIEEAIAIAQNRAANVSQVLYQSASIRGSTYLCLYYDGTLQNPYISIMAHAMVTK
jgi:hypothetical protein